MTKVLNDKEYEFYKMMLDAVQSFYDWSKENRDEPRAYTEWAFGGVSNETLYAVEYAFDEGLVE